MDINKNCILIKGIFNFYHYMGKFSRQQIDDIFLIFWGKKKNITNESSADLAQRVLQVNQA